MTFRTVAASALMILAISAATADAAGMLAINVGIATPVGVADDFLSQGYAVGIAYDWSARPIVGFETGFTSWSGTSGYEAYLSNLGLFPNSTQYKLNAMPFMFHMKFPLTLGAFGTAYLMGGVGFWRLTEQKWDSDDVHIAPGMNAGAGLNQTFTEWLGVSIECLYQILEYVPAYAPTEESWTHWVNLRAQLVFGHLRAR